LCFEPDASWSDPAPVDISEHVRLAPEDQNLGAAVARAMSGRLDRSRPLWDLELVPDAGNGRSAIVWRVHHAMADGMTMMHWASDLLWDEPPKVSAPAKVAAPPAAASLTSAVASVARTALSLGKELRPARSRGPFGGRVGSRRQAALASCSLTDLRSIEHTAGDGVTVNDVVLAAVAGALRRWCVHHGADLQGVRVQVPVSMHVHGPDAADLGNRDSFLFVDLPLDEPDPVARLRAVNRETRELKTHHDAEAVYDVLGTLERAAPPAARVAERFLVNPREFTLNVSNVPGPRSAVSVLGRPVSNLYSFAEIAERHPVRIAAVSLCDTMQFGVLTDPDLVPGTDTLAAGIEASVAELLS
jgi:WS/DGAT/MGAT family acyltransferase